MTKTKMAGLFGDGPKKFPGASVPKLIAVDTETTGLKWENDAIGISLAWRGPEHEMLSCYLHLGNDDLFSLGVPKHDVTRIMQYVFENHIPVFHTAPFDVRVIYKALGIIPGPSDDVVNISRNTEFVPSRSLAYLYTRHVGNVPNWVVEQKKKRANIEKESTYTIAGYARWDAEATLVVREALMDYQHLERDRKFSALVWSMLARGLPVNADFIEGRISEAHHRMLEISRNLGINPDSVPEVRRMAHSMGIALDSTSKEALKWHMTNPKIAQVVEYRELSKSVGSWYEPILKDSQHDGRIHARLNPFGTESYRMSAQDPNVQALPMKDRGSAFGSLMGIFRPQNPERELWQLDLKQAEVRMAAMLARDSDLAQVVNAGQDPYSEMSIRMYGTDEHRQKAKQATLAAIYEIGPRSFSETNGVPYTEAMQILDSFRNSFPQLRQASVAKRADVDRQRFVRLYTLRKRFFGPDEPSYKAFNQQVQGSVAELMADGMMRIDSEVGDEATLLLQIHDSVILEVDANNPNKQELLTAIGRSFHRCVPEILYKRTNPRVQLPVDVELWQ